MSNDEHAFKIVSIDSAPSVRETQYDCTRSYDSTSAVASAAGLTRTL